MKWSRALVLLGFTLACTERATPDASEAGRDSRSVIPSVSAQTDAYLISSSGMGAIRLGVTLEDARRALPSATFARTSDGDGVALVEVTLGADTSLTVYADEDDAEAPIEWTKRIQRIETFSPAFHTADGVRPGTLVSDVEGVFGRTREIMKSEIESREFIEFERQPAFLTLRLDYTGVFSGDARATQEYKPGAKILSIAIASN